MQDDDTGVDGQGDGRGAGQNDPLSNHSEIGRKLREYYSELESDKVPDRFADLLSQLERAEGARQGRE